LLKYVVVNNIVNIAKDAASPRPAPQKAREAQRTLSFLDISLRAQRLGSEVAWFQSVQHDLDHYKELLK